MPNHDAGEEPKRIELLARALIRWGDRILACRNVQKGYHYLPGGHVEPGESVRDAVVRELREELGLGSSVGPLLRISEERFTQDGGRRHELNLVFHVELKTSNADGSGSPPSVASREADIAFDWLDTDALESLRPESIRTWIRQGGGAATDRADGLAPQSS